MNATEYLEKNPMPFDDFGSIAPKATASKGKKKGTHKPELHNPFYVAQAIKGIPTAVGKMKNSDGVLALKRQQAKDEEFIARNKTEYLVLDGQEKELRAKVREVEKDIARNPANWKKYATDNALTNASAQFGR